MTYKNYCRYRVNPKMMCYGILQYSLNLYHSKKDYRDYLIWGINYYRHSYSNYSSSKFVRVCEEELERLDRLVDR